MSFEWAVKSSRQMGEMDFAKTIRRCGRRLRRPLSLVEIVVQALIKWASSVAGAEATTVSSGPDGRCSW